MEEEIALVIGDKAWSSWSLRPWLAAKVAGIPFREVPVRLRQPDTAAQIAQHSPSRHIPVLKRGGFPFGIASRFANIWRSLRPKRGFGPPAPEARAVARSISAEMHSGFQALRMEFPMDFHARIEGRAASDKARADIGRVVQIWSGTRREFGAGGPFLFGGFTIADAMYAPVATRFRTYGVDLAAFGDDGAAAAYAQAILGLPQMQEWGEGAARA